ncbi:hypothetical protein [Bosea sp. (in: a-proteobacteria)]|uniref:hypothetical protein n=1 Tax=Bosea sp. (in: a-proteobacteria) TaxID=1871050 RepID=UPI002DDCD4AE|nr:hypothetical protein [Bosea sp. (in: a-proteobacteria)]HEV2511269.1 hypothetical protein [Bosea sp. (in: a-proteobacteria)]
MNSNARSAYAERYVDRKKDRSKSSPEPEEFIVLGSTERDACQYIAELCEGLLLLNGVSRLPKLGLQLMLLHALCLDYVAYAQRNSAAAAA